MIIEIEDRFCKVAKVFSEVLSKVQRAAERGDAVHEVEELTLRSLLEMGRQTVVAYIQEQKEELPRPQVIEHEGKTLHRLRKRFRELVKEEIAGTVGDSTHVREEMSYLLEVLSRG